MYNATATTSYSTIEIIKCTILLGNTLLLICSTPLCALRCSSKLSSSIRSSSIHMSRCILNHPKDDTSDRVTTKVLYEEEIIELQKSVKTLTKKDQTSTKLVNKQEKQVQTLTKQVQTLTKLVNKQEKSARTYQAARKEVHARTRSTKTSPSDIKTSGKVKKQTNKQKKGARTLTTEVQTLTKLVNKQKGARTYQAAGKAHARAARAPKLSTLKVPAHRILSTLKTSPPGITSVTMKLKGLPQKNITGFYNQTRNEILKLLDQQEEKLPQEAMYMHIKTVQKYEEYDLWLKDKHHKALIVEKLDGNVITIADTTVGVSITSRTLQARKKVAKQQTQPNMEKHKAAATRPQAQLTRLNLKRMTEAEAKKFRPELREKLRAESSRVNEERTVGVSITSRTLQTRKKVAKQQTQPNMENFTSPPCERKVYMNKNSGAILQYVPSHKEWWISKVDDAGKRSGYLNIVWDDKNTVPTSVQKTWEIWSNVANGNEWLTTSSVHVDVGENEIVHISVDRVQLEQECPGFNGDLDRLTGDFSRIPWATIHSSDVSEK